MRALYTFRLNKTWKKTSLEVLVVFSPHDFFPVDEVDTLIQNDINENLSPDEILFVIPEIKFEDTREAFNTDAIATSILKRLNNSVTVTLVAYNARATETKRVTIKKPEPLQKTKLSEIIRPALTSIFVKNGGFVESTDAYHFVNPSGRHTDRFLRLSNILTRGADIYFMAFCCLQYIPKNAEFVYIDTMALFAIVSAVNEFRSLFGMNRLGVDNFRSYGGIQNIQPVSAEQFVVLISASSSGGLATKIQLYSKIPKSNLIHVLFLGSKRPDFPIVCDLSYSQLDNPQGIRDLPHVYTAEACAMCRTGSLQVYIQKEHFDVKGPQPKPIIIRRTDAPKNLGDTIERLSETDALELRVGSPDHKEFYINEQNLFCSDKQKDRLAYVLRRTIPSSTTHILQVDKGSEDFASQVRSHVHESGGNAEVVLRDQIDNLDVSSIRTLVVAAVVIESGRCLTDVSRDLRSIIDNKPIVYIVGMEKSSEFAQRTALERTLVECPNPVPHVYMSVDSMILPSSSFRNAWSDEAELFRDPDINCDLSEASEKIFKRRLKVLDVVSESLKKNGLFLQSNERKLLRLQRGFVLLPNSPVTEGYSQADVYYTIASVLQKLRSNSQSIHSGQSIRSEWYHQTILDPKNFTRFNDDVIQASLLRAATPAELNYRENIAESREAGRIICKVIDAANKPRGGAAPEFLLAVATQRLGLRQVDLTAILESAERSSGIVKDLGKVVQKKLVGSI